MSKKYKRKIEALARRIVRQEDKACVNFLRHKFIVLTPKLLTQEGIPFSVVVQEPGTFVFTEPGAYHCGFNVSFNAVCRRRFPCH